MPKVVLIAEDEVILSKMYKFNIEQAGFDVVMAANGQEAIDAMDKQRPDVLVLDLLMPKVDGFGVLEHMKSKKYMFPIIVLSNLSQDFDMNKCKELGVSDYFVKSEMDLNNLIEKMKKLVNL